MGAPVKKSEVLSALTDSQKTYKEHSGQTTTDAASEKKITAYKTYVLLANIATIPIPSRQTIKPKIRA